MFSVTSRSGGGWDWLVVLPDRRAVTGVAATKAQAVVEVVIAEAKGFGRPYSEAVCAVMRARPERYSRYLDGVERF